MLLIYGHPTLTEHLRTNVRYTYTNMQGIFPEKISIVLLLNPVCRRKFCMHSWFERVKITT